MTLTSIMNYPDRGKWGNPKYRGNCSGYVIRDLLLHYKPKQFGEVFSGGGTGYDVAREMGYQDSFHLDLNPRWGAFNALTDEMPESSDFVFLHPPYHNIVEYSGKMWGEAHPDDLSRCSSYEEFIRKLDTVHAKVYSSLRKGGRMAILVGDCRRTGEYFSIQHDMTWIGKLDAHLIKVQHNCVSDNRTYTGRFIPIIHEHLLVFRKDDFWVVPVAIVKKTEQDLRNSTKITWRDVVQSALEQMGGKSDLDSLYKIVKQTAKARGYATVEEKVRQTLQMGKDFVRVQPGVWKLNSFERIVATVA